MIFLGYRFDMRNKTPQQQNIVRDRDRRNQLLKENDKNNIDSSSNHSDLKKLLIKETRYCKLWKSVSIKLESGGVAAIELITVKELSRDEVRFAYYKENNNGKLRLVPRPLDVSKEELEELWLKAKKEGIIS